jgi:hypothetical protein
MQMAEVAPLGTTGGGAEWPNSQMLSAVMTAFGAEEAAVAMVVAVVGFKALMTSAAVAPARLDIF